MHSLSSQNCGVAVENVSEYDKILLFEKSPWHDVAVGNFIARI